MDIERQRGITIKSQSVRIPWTVPDGNGCPSAIEAVTWWCSGPYDYANPIADGWDSFRWIDDAEVLYGWALASPLGRTGYGRSDPVWRP